MIWYQNYNPFHNLAISAIVAAIPILILLVTLATGKIKAPFAAGLGLLAALSVAIGVYRMPIEAALGATAFGVGYGLFPIGWIVLNLLFLYRLTVDKGLFAVVRDSLGYVTPDSRVQLLLIAFCLGSFFEGVAGLGTPVALTAAILIQLGFKPLQASGLSLIANTAPVAFGALGIPIIALSGVTGLDIHKLSMMTGRIAPVFSILIPFWIIWAMVGFRKMLEVWPAPLIAGVAYAIPQSLISNFHGPWLVDIVASASSMFALLGLLRIWKPRSIMSLAEGNLLKQPVHHVKTVFQAWSPWVILSLVVLLWALPSVKMAFDGVSPLGSSAFHIQLASKITTPTITIPRLHGLIARTPPIAPENAPPEKAILTLNWLSATGTGILVASILAAIFAIKCTVREFVTTYFKTLFDIRMSLITIAAMISLGTLTKYSGTDATLGMALSHTGVLYPFFGTLLGWLGVALTGSDTASNVR